MSKSENKAATEMTETMENTMKRLKDRFQTASQQLEAQMEDMGTRIVDLEKNVTKLMAQAGMEEQAMPK